MKELNTRIGLRISEKLRNELDTAVELDKFGSRSDLIRKSIVKFLKYRKKRAIGTKFTNDKYL